MVVSSLNLFWIYESRIGHSIHGEFPILLSPPCSKQPHVILSRVPSDLTGPFDKSFYFTRNLYFCDNLVLEQDDEDADPERKISRLLMGLLRLVVRFYKDRIARAKKRFLSICICFTNSMWRSMLPQI